MGWLEFLVEMGIILCGGTAIVGILWLVGRR